MGVNDYVMELYVKAVLQEARDGAQRRALLDRPRPVVAPILRAVLGRMRARYARWSSVAPAGAKPTTVRAWSKSR